MKNLPLFLAWRYLTGTKKEKSISVMVAICFIGIFIGSMALCLVASVMNGFEKVTHENIKSINPQIVIHSGGQEINFDALKKVLESDFIEIENFSPSGIGQLITQSDFQNSYNISYIKGIDPEKEKLVCDIEKKIIAGKVDLNNSKVIIGQNMAKDLGVKTGDKINLFFSNDAKIKGRKIKLKQDLVTISGIMKTGIDEFDSNLIISSLETFNRIFPDKGITHIDLKLKYNYSEKDFIAKFNKRFEGCQLDCQSWQDLYPALIEALKLEKYIMFFILALITLVASMSIISLLFMQIIQKRGDIAILKAIGMSNKKISQIFLYLGMSISVISSIAGIATASICAFILERYKLITLPDAYFVTHLPAKMDWNIVISVFTLVIILGLISTWIPLRRMKKINISQTLRLES